MPVTRSKTTAFVNVRGLGIVCFNPTLQRCETAIIRSGNHQLSIEVSRPGIVDGTGIESTGFVSLHSQPITDLEDVTIEITAVGKSTYEGYETFQAPQFERLGEGNDDNDIRWIINLEGDEMHGSGLVPSNAVSATGKPPVTRLYISNALFYAVMPSDVARSTTPFFMKTDPRTGTTTEFGHIAETLGANIESDSVQIKITVGGAEQVMTYDHVEGSPIKIDIVNVDTKPDALASDLPVCYQFLSDVTGFEFTLTPLEDDSNAGESSTGKNFCHITQIEQESIDFFV